MAREKLLDGVKILLVGDSGVGKTSLINSLMSQKFTTGLPARLIGVNISAEVNPEHVPIHVEDFSQREQTYDDLRDIIQDSDAICIVFTESQPQSLDRVFAHWIPLIHKCQQLEVGTFYKPIIMVHNKTDLLAVESKIADKIRDNVDGFIQVSALTQENVAELFYLAQRSVIYPKAPLFDPHLRVITKKCRSALIEIFKLCDLDNDGLLNDHELNLFQENCFGVPLQKDALDDLKSIIKQSTRDGISDNGITLSGFLFFHTLSIVNGQSNFTWQVLRKFNYNNSIETSGETTSEKVDELAEDFLKKASLSNLNDGLGEVHGRNSIKVARKCVGRKNDSEEHSSEQVKLTTSSQIDLYNYCKGNSKVIKAGFGFTLITVVSVLALKYLIQSGRSA